MLGMKRDDITRALVKAPLKTVVGWEKLESIMLLDRNDESVAYETFKVSEYKDCEVAGWVGHRTYVYKN